jgi:hypothetical protein
VARALRERVRGDQVGKVHQQRLYGITVLRS